VSLQNHKRDTSLSIRFFPKTSTTNGDFEMKAYVISEDGGPEKLVLKDVAIPQIKPGWILIKVRAEIRFLALYSGILSV
jgi:hypothetical protein